MKQDDQQSDQDMYDEELKYDCQAIDKQEELELQLEKMQEESKTKLQLRSSVFQANGRLPCP